MNIVLSWSCDSATADFFQATLLSLCSITFSATLGCVSDGMVVSMLGAIEHPKRLIEKRKIESFLSGMNVPVDLTLM